MQVYRIMRDVTGEAYTLLLEAALKEASTFSLVWRDQLQFGPSAAAVREALRSLQLRHVKRDRWPGTILVGHYASVVTYRAAPEALPALLEPGSLFAWQSPAYPQDKTEGEDGGVEHVPPKNISTSDEQDTRQPEDATKAAVDELARWERFALKRMGRAQGRPFAVRALPDEIAFEVAAGLLAAQSEDEMRAVFKEAREQLAVRH